MIIVAGTARLKPGAREAMTAALGPMIEGTLAEEGCHACRYAYDAADPDVMHFYEEYESEEALQQHFTQPHLGAFYGASGELMDGRPTMKKWVDAVEGEMSRG